MKGELEPRESANADLLPLSLAFLLFALPKMACSLPTEVLERIIFYCFQRDELLHTPEDNFTLVTPTRGSTSLLLVSKDFRLLILPSLFESVSISQQHDWELLYRKGSGLLDGEGEGARTRRSWVRELRINMDVELPIAFQPDGSLPPDPPPESNDAKPILITLSLPTRSNHPTPFFPNLNRLTLLHDLTTSIPRSLLPLSSVDLPTHWPLQDLQQVEETIIDFYASHPEEDPFGDEVEPAYLRGGTLHELHEESMMTKEDFLSSLGCKAVWTSMMDPTSVRETARSSLWGNKEIVKHIVYPSSPSPSSSSLEPATTTTATTPFPPIDTFLTAASIVDEFRWSAAHVKRVRFINVPLPLRRRLWAKLNKMAAAGSEYDYDGEDEGEGVKEGEVVDWLLEALKKEWVWVEEDGREVEFEEGLRLVGKKKEA